MRIFYQSPVARDWIRQRPHFIAEGLARCGHQVFWFYAGSFLKTRFRRIDDDKGLVGLELPVLPFASRCRPIERLNHWWVSWWLRRVAPDVVVMTHPVVLPWLPEHIARAPILYDCMDVQAAFFTGRRRRRMVETERELVSKANCVVASSEPIRDNLVVSYGVLPDRVAVVPNGVELSWSGTHSLPIKTAHPSIAYFGTVASWFDWEGVKTAAVKHPEWSFDIFGPVADIRTNLPPNVIFHGAIPHAQVYAQAQSSDMLIMPFLRNELVDGVDPVKMYEYLRTGRPIVSSWWPLLEKFRRFEAVHFYGGAVTLLSALETAMGEDRTYPVPAAFLDDNSWERRCRDFCDVLSSRGEHALCLQ